MLKYLLPNYVPTPWYRVLLEQLTGLRLVEKFPHFTNPKVHYRTHKRPPSVPIVGQPNLVHIPTSYLLEIHPNIIHPSTPRSPQWSLSLRFSHQDPIHPFSSPIRATCPAYLILSILSPAQYWVRSTDHIAPRYAVSSIPPLPCLSEVQIPN